MTVLSSFVLISNGLCSIMICTPWLRSTGARRTRPRRTQSIKNQQHSRTPCRQEDLAFQMLCWQWLTATIPELKRVYCIKLCKYLDSLLHGSRYVKKQRKTQRDGFQTSYRNDDGILNNRFGYRMVLSCAPDHARFCHSSTTATRCNFSSQYSSSAP